MIRLVYSNDSRVLLETLADDLDRSASESSDPLEALELVLPDRGIESYVRLGLAEIRGTSGHLRARRLERWARELAATVSGGRRLLDAEALRGGLLSVLSDASWLRRHGLDAVQSYIGVGGPEGRARRLVQLSRRIARRFEEYAFTRPDLLERWGSGQAAEVPGEAWQSRLWSALSAADGPFDRQTWITLDELLRAPFTTPPALAFFGLSFITVSFQALIASAAERGTSVTIYHWNPCREFWEDVETVGERRRRLGRRNEAPSDDPFGLFATDDTPLLRAWGRPGRETVRLLDELTDCDFDDRFRSPPSDGSLLQRLQSDIVGREPERDRDAPRVSPDGSLIVLTAPSPRRLLECVADRIWSLVLGDAGSRRTFDEIAVLLAGPAADELLLLLESVFVDFRRIPWRLSDPRLARDQPVTEAVRRLLDLPFGRFSRREVLGLLTHPRIDAGAEGDDHEVWADLVERTAILYGASFEAFADSFVDRDLYSWDQGLRRAAVGSRIDPRAAQSAGETAERGWVSVATDEAGSVARLARTTRELLSDASAIREASLPLAEWAVELGRLLDRWVDAESDRDRRTLARLRRDLVALADLDTVGRPISGLVAVELVKESLTSSTASWTDPGTEGVTVATLGALRSRPFRDVFVVGLDDGGFPAATPDDPLDLRLGSRRAGDVSPAERDRYGLLETLVSTRDSLLLGSVTTDPANGAERPPAGPVQDLLRVVDGGYLESGATIESRLGIVPTEASGSSPELLRELLPVTEDEAVTVVDRPEASLGARDRIEDHSGPARGRSDVSLSALVDFLASPLDAWSRELFGRPRGYWVHPELEDEPLDSESWAKARALRRGLVDWSHEPDRRVSDIIEQAVEPLVRLASVPDGPPGRAERRRLERALERWRARLEDTCGRMPTFGLPRRGWAAASPSMSEDELPPLDVSVESALRLTGSSSCLVAEDRGTIVAVRPSALGTPAKRVQPRLRGLVEHLVTSAAGGSGADRWLLALDGSPDGKGERRYRLTGLDPATARKLLFDLGRDLLDLAHPYVLPAEIVFEAWRDADKRWDRIDAAEIVERIDRALTAGRDLERTGLNPEHLAPPSVDRVAKVLEDRLVPIFSLAEESPW